MQIIFFFVFLFLTRCLNLQTLISDILITKWQNHVPLWKVRVPINYHAEAFFVFWHGLCRRFFRSTQPDVLLHLAQRRRNTMWRPFCYLPTRASCSRASPEKPIIVAKLSDYRIPYIPPLPAQHHFSPFIMLNIRASFWG